MSSVYNNCIRTFMVFKQLKIGTDYNYCTLEDTDNIRLWSDDHSKEVWKDLEKHYNRSKCSLDSSCCPFCIYHDMTAETDCCNECDYGAIHGKCNDFGSDFDLIPDNIKINFPWKHLFKKACDKYNLSIETEKKTLKLWKDKHKDDPKGQIYIDLYLDQNGSITLIAVDSKGRRIPQGTLFVFQSQYLGKTIACDAVSDRVSEILETDDNGKLVII